MRPFDRYVRDKMKDAGFRALYAAECHVCRTTLRIFEKVALENISLENLARDVNADPTAVAALRDADCCDPALVMRLCQRLGIDPPEACPRHDPDREQR